MVEWPARTLIMPGMHRAGLMRPRSNQGLRADSIRRTLARRRGDPHHHMNGMTMRLGFRTTLETALPVTPQPSAAETVEPDSLHVGKDNLHARAYLTLRKALVMGRFRPGQRLLLKPLADELGISVTPVREALLRLASEHGLVADRSRTMIVPVLSVARFREIRDIRVDLEGRAAEVAAKLAATNLAQLEEIHQDMVRARLNRDVSGALSSNQAFHFAIYQSADLPVLYSLIEGLWVRIGPLLTCLYDYVGPEAVHEHPHRAILTALAAGDSAAARLAMANDIMWASNYLEKVVVALNEPRSGKGKQGPVPDDAAAATMPSS